VKVDRSAWGRIRVTGSDRVRFLQGLTTVNVETLGDGTSRWGAILSPKGRVLSVISLAAAGDALVVRCEPALADKTLAILERYAVMDDVAFEPGTDPCYQVWTDAASVWDAPFVVASGVGEAGDVAETAPAAERLRIRGGFLRYGADVGEDHFPFETPLARALDYDKGCYVGQEPVFRVHAQGNAARALRGLSLAGEPPAPGTPVGKGVITSAVDDGAGGALALAYLHRTQWEPGTTIAIGDREATIHELPW
jgi:tRNA-modifying protein YgfZ